VIDGPESLAVLLLPCRLEDFELAAHARDLLAIPRVVALEPPRARPHRLRRTTVTIIQARRLRFPGQPRAFVLYHPAQYPLARALLGVHDRAEFWYAPPDPAALDTLAERGDKELIEFDDLARARAEHLLDVTPQGDTRVENEPLRSRLWDLGVISHRPFVPGPGRRPPRISLRRAL
jgi:hypothetical protein